MPDLWQDSSAAVKHRMVLPLIGKDLVDEVLDTIGVYVAHCHNTMAQYISMRPTFDILVTEERRRESPALLCWWDQAGIFLEMCYRWSWRRKICIQVSGIDSN